MKKQGILLIISGPSGSGKGTIVGQLCEKNDFALSISATTRKPREKEEHGVHYFFHTREEFEQMKERKELLEWAEFCGNYYGTPRKYVTEQLMQGKNVILEIEVQGASKVRASRPDSVGIFILPPSLEELERRLRNRQTDSPEVIEKRIALAPGEIAHSKYFDYCVVNDDIGTATDEVYTILKNLKEDNNNV